MEHNHKQQRWFVRGRPKDYLWISLRSYKFTNRIPWLSHKITLKSNEIICMKSVWNPIQLYTLQSHEIIWDHYRIPWNHSKIPWNQFEIPWNLSIHPNKNLNIFRRRSLRLCSTRRCRQTRHPWAQGDLGNMEEHRWKDGFVASNLMGFNGILIHGI